MVFRYFTSHSGKKFILFSAGATTAGLFLVNYVPHTFGLERYKSFIQSYRNGQPVTLSNKLNERLIEAAKILNYDSSEINMIKPFSVYGFELFSAGSTSSKFGGLIGIPFNYELDTVEQIKSHDIQFQGQKVNWNNESGNKLASALILTKEEQIFGICKSLLQLQSNYVILNSVYPSVSFLMVYCVGHYLNQSLNLLKRPIALRLFMYMILGLFGFGSYSFITDYSQVTADAEVDEKLSSISPSLMKAGISFYDKQLRKNIALKEIGKSNTYTTKGNVNYFLRQKSLPLTVRKQFFEEKHNEYLKSSN